jgi:hypothetical protein
MSLSGLKQLKQVQYRNWSRELCHPELLLHPQIPRAMKGLNPRTVLGNEWWQSERRKAIAKTEGHCAACGVHKMNAEKYQWLECHEQYDYVGKQLIYKDCVPLCHYCHAFIHRGRLKKLWADREITEKELEYILRRGLCLLKEVLAKPALERRKPRLFVDSETGWSLKIGDQVYEARH